MFQENQYTNLEIIIYNEFLEDIYIFLFLNLSHYTSMIIDKVTIGDIIFVMKVRFRIGIVVVVMEEVRLADFVGGGRLMQVASLLIAFSESQAKMQHDC